MNALIPSPPSFILDTALNRQPPSCGDNVSTNDGRMLYPHQKNSLSALMQAYETSCIWYDNGTRINSRTFIYADSTGSGKTLVLQHLARQIKTIPNNSIHCSVKYRMGPFKGGVDITIREECKPQALVVIVVPHYLMHQWKCEWSRDEARSKDEVYFISNKRQCLTLPNNKIVVVKDTMTTEFVEKQKLQFSKTHYLKCLIFDEPQNCRIPSSDNLWRNISIHRVFLVCATPNILFQMSSCSATPFLRNIGSRLCGYITLRHSEACIQKSLQLEPVCFTSYTCSQSNARRYFAKYLPEEFKLCFLENENSRVYASLANNPLESRSTILQGILRRFEVSINTERATVAFVKSNENYTAAQKQERIDACQEKIAGLQEKIQSIETLVNTMCEEDCVICFNSLKELTNCVLSCGHVFCYDCIRHLEASTCPMCRKPFDLVSCKTFLHPEAVKPENLETVSDTDVLPKLVRLWKVLTDFKDMPYKMILHTTCKDYAARIKKFLSKKSPNLNLHHFVGGEAVLRNLISKFETQDQSILFLTGVKSISGINLPCTTHILLLNSITESEKKQIVGRAWRPGRTCPLQLVLFKNSDA